MSRVRLRDIAACFEGVIPSPLCTCSLDGVPNVTYLSIVHRLDEDHVGLSVQFFNKTRRNVLENPRASTIVVDPGTLDEYRLELMYERSDLQGEVFDYVRARLAAVASQSGMSEVFTLRGVDVYRVLDCHAVRQDRRAAGDEAADDPLAHLALFAEHLAACRDLEGLLTAALEQIDRCFGQPHAFVMLRDETGQGLFTVASRGFELSGVGSEITIGEGLIGVAASERRVVRSTNLARDRALTSAVRDAVGRAGDQDRLRREIALPGLANPSSQLVVPLLAQNELVGVLCLQSAVPGRFLAADERTMLVAGHQLAACIALLGGAAGSSLAPATGFAQPHRPAAGTTVVRHHRSDDSVFIGDAYVIKGVAGRLLLKMLKLHLAEGRLEFTNKELRVDAALRLPEYQDNLEARLVLLRKRLAERGGAILLTRTGRGRLRLGVSTQIRLEEMP